MKRDKPGWSCLNRRSDEAASPTCFTLTRSTRQDGRSRCVCIMWKINRTLRSLQFTKPLISSWFSLWLMFRVRQFLPLWLCDKVQAIRWKKIQKNNSFWIYQCGCVHEMSFHCSSVTGSFLCLTLPAAINHWRKKVNAAHLTYDVIQVFTLSWDVSTPAGHVGMKRGFTRVQEDVRDIESISRRYKPSGKPLNLRGGRGHVQDSWLIRQEVPSPHTTNTNTNTNTDTNTNTNNDLYNNYRLTYKSSALAGDI